jgi:phage terminase Nu1 subunit (DNA packaging protein)
MASKRSPRAIPLAQATKERARLARAQADLTELKAAKQRGLLLDAAAVETEWSGVSRLATAVRSRSNVSVCRYAAAKGCSSWH